MRGRPKPLVPLFASFLMLLLLMPSFLVAPSAHAADTSSLLATASAQTPASNSPKPLSGYKSAGLANPDLPVTVSVVVPIRNLAALDSLVKQVSDPNSPDFRHFLSRAQVSQTFLPTDAQYHAVLDYLLGHGFSLEFSALNSMIVVQGTAADVNQYLGQDVQVFTNGTYSYYETTGATSLAGAFSFGSNSSALMMRPNLMRSGSVASAAIPGANVTFAEGGQSTKLLRAVYNSTTLLSNGYDGKGYTIGLLDFYGYTSVASDLALYDSTYGVPAPSGFTVAPIGPYNPNLGSQFGWDGEIDLDVQTSHAMAPSASIILYAANGALSLASAVAGVVQDGRANVVSQSFGLPEWEYYEAGALPYLFNSVFVDDYYALGSAMGMTFLASSGDAGGSGYSSGPEGGVEYPGSSPFVTTLGGTTTYISSTASGTPTANQTAWSNIGFVPYFANLGGSGGGVSILEPTPWYQSSLPVPSTYPSGRLNPDLSLDSSGTPGTFIIYQGKPLSTGGTSEASPLFAGLLTLVMGYTRGSLGLVNPSLYQMAGDPKTYQTAFTPITFGYTIPWVAKLGYNLATGWGAPNIGEIATLYSSSASSSSLDVKVDVLNPGKTNVTDFLSGESIKVVAGISAAGGAAVTTGAFSAALQTLQGTTASVPLTYDPAQGGWTGTIVVGDQSGIAYVNVAGSSGASTGSGFADTFVGYLADFLSPLAPYPWTTLVGLQTAVSVTDLFGKPPTSSTTDLAIDTYSILDNAYRQVSVSTLDYSSGNGYYAGTVKDALPDGVTVLRMQGPVVGYLPIVSGISFAGTDIYPQVVAEPGTVAPGQSLTIVAKLTAPENLAGTQSYSTGDTLGNTIAYGSNVTATLVDQTGSALASVTLPNHVCAQALKVCGAGLTLINGYLTIPPSASPGLYTVLLSARYNDETTKLNYTGSFFGQVYVASGASVPKVSVTPGTLYEGQSAQITADITYPNGKEVTSGLYSALVYPKTAQEQYSSLMHSTYAAFDLIQLAYSPDLNLWVADVTMPSPYNASLVSSINGNAGYYGGPYDVYVSGISADGSPTTSDLSAQHDFFVQPYVFTANQVLTDPRQTSDMAMTNVTLISVSSPLTLTNDQFVGANSIQGSNVTISSSDVAGTLNVSSAQTTLVGVRGGDIVLTSGHLRLLHSDVSSLRIGAGATVSLDSASSFQSVSPPLPVVTVSSPVANQSYTGDVSIEAAVAGTSVADVTFTLDGKPLAAPASLGPSGSYSLTLNGATMLDGTHELSIVATQSDGLSSSASVSFTTQSQLAAANALLKATGDSLSSATANISSLQSQAASYNRSISDLTDIAYIALVVAGATIVLIAYVARKSNAPWKY